MRLGGPCWKRTAVLVAGCITLVLASNSNNDYRESSEYLQNQTPQLEEQKIVVPVLPGTPASGDEQERTSCEDANEEAMFGGGEVFVTTTTTEVDVTVTHPKITEGPLVKRKLGSERWNLIHEGIQGQKRDATSCPSDYQLCPKSLNGGCCPNDRVCGASSCLPTSAGPTSACGMLGYVACAISDGGGCCPENYVCGQAGCSPSAGVSYSETCGVNSYLCPASLNYGCCQNGMGCALNGCWTTSATTFTLTETFTTKDTGSNAVTVTTSVLTAATPSAPTATATAGPDLIPKVSSAPTAIAKTAASGGPSNTGLSKAAVGGIIGGAVVFLLVIVLIAFLILQKLKAIETASNARSRTHSSSKQSGPRSGRSGPGENPDLDAMSIDPLMMAESTRGNSVRYGSYQSSQNSAHEVEASTPQSPPYTHYPRGYNPVAPSDSAYSGGHRNGSVESTPPMSQNQGYFDYPRRGDRSSRGSLQRRPSAHGRNWSNASGESDVSAVSDPPAELYAGTAPKRRPSIQETLSRFPGLGLGSMIKRKLSISQPEPPPPLAGGPQPPRSDRPSPMSPPLGGIQEAKESHDHLPATRMQELTGSQLKAAGLSNSQLREMTLAGQNPYSEYTPDLKN